MRDDGQVFSAEQCRKELAKAKDRMAFKKVQEWTTLALSSASKGESKETIRENPDNNKFAISRLKDLGFKIIETGNNHFIFSWEE